VNIKKEEIKSVPLLPKNCPKKNKMIKDKNGRKKDKKYII